MNYEEALEWLSARLDLERTGGTRRHPTLERIEALVDAMGHPELAYKVIHVTGTNGKGSTVRMASALLSACGFAVGSYSSPHLDSPRERMAYDGDPIPPDELAEELSAIRQLTEAFSIDASWFEIMTAAAFRWFADRGIDIAVVEVGLGGTFDATNVVHSDVCVITNIELDHTEILGSTREAIAKDKSGIVKPDCALVLGEPDPELFPIFEQAALMAPTRSVSLRGRDFDSTKALVALGGRVVDVFTSRARYEEIYLSLFGVHQALNASVALEATEALMGAAVPKEVVESVFATMKVPGRLEILQREPLVLIDGAHNPAGMRALGTSLAEDFAGTGPFVGVLGMLSPRDPREMLEALGPEKLSGIVCCAPKNPRALPPETLSKAAQERGLPTEVVPECDEAVRRAISLAGPDGAVVVAGSLYAVGEVRKGFMQRRS
jgi:dihydrofolate synthase/folylpolyglutamate synthase